MFMHALTNSHWAAIKCILHYLKGMLTRGLHITCILWSNANFMEIK